MIKRSAAKNIPSIVNSAASEHQTASEGIRRDKPVTDIACTTDTVNFDVANDRTLILRKPLLRKYASTNFRVLLHDKTTVLEWKNSIDGWFFYKVGASSAYTVKYTSYKNVTKSVDEGIDFSGAEVIYTNSGTLITNVKVYPTKLNDFYDPELATYSATDFVYRYVYIYFEDSTIKAIIVNPEINTLVSDTESATNFNPNLLLDNPYALRDLYNYGAISCTYITPYRDTVATYGTPTHTKIATDTVNVSICEGLFKFARDTSTLSNPVLIVQRPTLLTNINYIKETEAPSTEDEFETSVYLTYNIKGTETYTNEEGTVVEVEVDFNIGAKVPKFMPAGYAITIPIISESTLTYTVTSIACLTAISAHVFDLGTRQADLATAKSSSYDLSTLTYVISSHNTVTYKNGMFSVSIDTSSYPSANKITMLTYSTTDANAYKLAVKTQELSKTYSIVENSTFYIWLWKDNNVMLNFNTSVKKATESVESIGYDMIAALPTEVSDSFQTMLKAWLTLPYDTESLSKYYGIWECSSDCGTTWDASDVFESRNASALKRIPVVDASTSDETVEAIDDYVTYKYMLPINAKSNSDSVGARIDCLPILGCDILKQYRFSIYKYVPSKIINNTCTVTVKDYASVPAVTDDKDCIYIAYDYDKHRVVNIAVALQGTHTVQMRYGLSKNLLEELDDGECNTSICNKVVTSSTNVRFDIYNVLTDSQTTAAYQLKLLVLIDGEISKSIIFNICVVYKLNSFGELQISNVSQEFSAEIAQIGSNNGSAVAYDMDAPIYVYPNRTYAIKYVYKCNVYNPTDIPKIVCLKAIPSYDTPNNFTKNIPFRTSTYLDLTSMYTSNQNALVRLRRFQSIDYMKLSFVDVIKDNIFFGNAACMYFIGDTTVTQPTESDDLAYAKTKNAYLGIRPLYKDRSLKLINGFNVVTIPARSNVPLTFEFYVTFNPWDDSLEPGTDEEGRNVNTRAKELLDGKYTCNDMLKYIFATISLNDFYSGVYILNKPVSRELDTYYRYSGNYLVPKTRTGYFQDVLNNHYHPSTSYTYVDNLEMDALAFLTTSSTSTYMSKAILISQKIFAPYTDASLKLLQSDDYKVVSGKHVFYNNQIFTYGVKDHEAEIFVSETDSFITPMYNTLDISQGYTVRNIMPWRNYLLIFTDYNIMLASYDATSGTYNSKVLTTTVGVPEKDADTVATLLNSVVFKSHGKVYRLVPNLYSTSDSIMNLSCISDAIEGLMADTDKSNFAFSTDDMYYLFMPKAATSTDAARTDLYCYDYGKKTWTRHTYPVMFTDYEYISVDDILLYSGYDVYYFDKTLQELGAPNDKAEIMKYGDIVSADAADVVASLKSVGYSTATVKSIPFIIDLGHRSVSYTTEKQFVESKHILATCSTLDSKFPFTVDIYTDDVRPMHVHMDVTTDSPFWTDNPTLDILSTEFVTDDAERAGTLRQLFVKYAGRGKSIRHILHGESVSRFKFYAIDVRYKVLPVKQ